LKALLSLSRAIDRLSGWVGQLAAVAMLAACAISCGNALLRYSLSITSNFWLEIQWYLFGAMFMLGAAYTLKLNEHVRVDLVYGMLKPRTRLIIDILGTLLFLIPTCALGGWLTFWFFWDSWQTGEQAANAAGLPRWPAFSGANRVLYIGDPIGVGGLPDQPALSTFDAVYAQVRGAPVGASGKP